MNSNDKWSEYLYEMTEPSFIGRTRFEKVKVKATKKAKRRSLNINKEI